MGEAADVVLGGGVALVPTDTVYGLAVSPLAPEAVDRVFAMKGRPGSKNLPVMVGDVGAVPALGVDVNDAAQRLLSSELVPGPLTIAFGFGPGDERPEWLAGRVEVAVRIPAHDLLRGLLRRTGPLLVTSANRSGEPTAENLEAILASLLEPPDLVLDGGQLSSTPSTLINCRPVPPVVERVGAAAPETVERILHGA
ncbi:threonylcarbamoyl-AMP synthase [Motilibacter sp. E257]|uniref:L-threonylcarbamoyladenylate synthase n=2 Tax=Motilibacter deserti TaxID=2714956 RepID=A0ABX0GTC4_9ACTN|nr:threonylcarbamoyl-AMP synthase [Motilibacter deserti]